MTQTFDLAKTFIHLDGSGGAEPVEVTRSFWSGNAAGNYVRLVGVFDFDTSKDLHASTEEVHPEADEVLFVISGEIELVLEDGGVQRVVPLGAGEATIVPRGRWHRLVMRRPGRILFINSRAGMQSRPRRSTERRGAE